MMDRFLHGFGRVLAWVNGSLLAAFAALLVFSRGRGFLGGLGVSFTAMFLVLTLAGLFLAWRMGLRIREDAWRKNWMETLRFIQKGKGRITPIELATHLNCDLGEAKSLLDALVQEGHGEVKLTETYQTFYYFPLTGNMPDSGSPVAGTFSPPPVPAAGIPAQPRKPQEKA